jgi:hypothetical protein
LLKAALCDLTFGDSSKGHGPQARDKKIKEKRPTGLPKASTKSQIKQSSALGSKEMADDKTNILRSNSTNALNGTVMSSSSKPITAFDVLKALCSTGHLRTLSWAMLHSREEIRVFSVQVIKRYEFMFINMTILLLDYDEVFRTYWFRKHDHLGNRILGIVSRTGF